MLKFFLFGTCLMAMLSFSEAFHASVKGEGHYCIMFEGNITGSIDYQKKDNTTSSHAFTVDESSLSVGGDCYMHLDPKSNATGETLTVAFIPLNSSEAQQQWNLKIEFVSKQDNSFEIGDLTLSVLFGPEMNASIPSAEYKLKDSAEKWAVSDAGYACSSSKLELSNDSSLEFKNVRVLAFAQLPEDKFPSGQFYQECAADSKTSEIVPIIVGACLAGLVVVVLIAYLIGRARAKRQGYASV
ncbi:LAMP family protein lmp-1 [Aphelenchoides bicaudatus]|nr:LAMP family protein lmp-1 [Aphelenchoides bicaudatus]